MTGLPTPSISWLYSNLFIQGTPSLIANGGQYMIENTVVGNMVTSQLNITNVAFSNIGSYVCQGINFAPRIVQALLIVAG